MNDLEFIESLVNQNRYLTTEEEKSWYRSALCATLNWGHKIDREQAAYNRAQKLKSIIYRS